MDHVIALIGATVCALTFACRIYGIFVINRVRAAESGAGKRTVQR